MANYIDMITRIQDEFVNESMTVAHIKRAMKSAIGAYENTPLYFNQKEATFQTSGGKEYYGAVDLADIPNIVKIYNASRVDAYGNIPLKPIGNEQLEGMALATSFGPPSYFSVVSQKIRLHLIPDNFYSIKLFYLYKFDDLVNDIDTNAWLNDGEELIRQATKRRLALDILQSDTLAARCKILEDEAFDGLLAETRQRLPNTKLSYGLPVPSHGSDIMVGNNTIVINEGGWGP